MEGLLKNQKRIKIYCHSVIFFQDPSNHFFFFFFPFHFPFFFFSIWQIRFLVLVPAEGNKELCFWSDDLICTLMKSCSQLHHPLATRGWRGPASQPQAPSWPVTSLNVALLHFPGRLAMLHIKGLIVLTYWPMSLSGKRINPAEKGMQVGKLEL